MDTKSTDVIRNYLTGTRKFNTVSDKYYAYISNWNDWYKGFYSAFHSYNQYNGTQFVKRKMYTLGMAKKICQDWASLLMNEKVGISTGDDTADTMLETIFKANNFRVRANQLVEIAFALGTGAFVEYADADDKPIIDYVRAQMIYPLSWDNGDITECAFASLRNIGGTDYYYINIHSLDDKKNYVVENKFIKIGDSESPEEVTFPEIEPIVKTNSPLPRFQIISPNLVNNIDYDSPMGISVFANAIDEIKAVDVAYDSYVNEYQLGKKRIMVPMSMIKTAIDGADGIFKPVFDPNDVAFYAMDDDSLDGIKEINMELRAEQHETGLQRFISLAGDKCGLGIGRYKFEQGQPQTATQVISEQSDMYQNIKKNELILEAAMVNMTKVLAEMSGISPDSLEIKVDFDDSIIQNKDDERNRMLILVNAGRYPLWRYLAQYENYTEEEAKAIEQEAQVEAPTVESGFGSAEPAAAEGTKLQSKAV